MDFKKIGRLILIEQTLFTLPFAYIGVLFAGGADIAAWLLVTLALASARTAGMSFNRAIDADIDAKNPRTKDRHIPKGELSKRDAWILAAVSSIILIISSYMLNDLCFGLSSAAVALLFTYSYFKRFSASSHFYLGFVEAAAPIGGYLAVTGEFASVPFALGFAIMTWIAGLDIVYALQDYDFDKAEGLHSVPVAIGRNKALAVSAASYCAAVAALAYAGIAADRSYAYWAAILCIAFIFVYQQVIARSEDIQPAVKKYFRANMFISPVLFIGTFIDVYFL